MLQSMYSNSSDDFLKNSLGIVDKQVVTLTKLISDLLDLSKIKTGSLMLNKENFSVNELIKNIITEIKLINPEYTILFTAEKEAMLYADRERIGQVVINFLTNAVKYSPAVQLIKVESIVNEKDVIISVEDSGIGINKTDQQKIFERFYRVEGKNEKTFPGFGIGLFITAEIIQRHNGKIGVKSEPGKGSVFYCSLPLATNHV
jgi:signal transduction histidine kinase